MLRKVLNASLVPAGFVVFEVNGCSGSTLVNDVGFSGRVSRNWLNSPGIRKVSECFIDGLYGINTDFGFFYVEGHPIINMSLIWS